MATVMSYLEHLNQYQSLPWRRRPGGYRPSKKTFFNSVDKSYKVAAAGLKAGPRPYQM